MPDLKYLCKTIEPRIISKNVNEVRYNVGYNDPKAFRTTFKYIYGRSLVPYHSKYIPAPEIAV